MSDRQLVFGDDRSVDADHVWGWIDGHDWPRWRISVVTAKMPGAPDEGLHPWEPDEPRALSRPGAGTVVEHLAAAGDPRDVLGNCRDATLVAVGPRGTGRLKSMVLGSTTESLLSIRPAVPALAIIRSAAPTRHILLFADGSNHAQRAADLLADLPWIGQCRVTVLGLVDGVSDAEGGIARAVAALAGTGAEVETQKSGALRGTYTMDVKSVLLDIIAEQKPDLVTLGTRGLGGFRRMLLGSTARTVAHYAQCSTIITHAGDD